MRFSYAWDVDLDESQFSDLLDGKAVAGRLDYDWAAVRLLEYAPYSEIVRLLGFKRLLEGWPRWREHLRSHSRRRGFDFLVAWLPKNHPERIK